ncbi:GtrA family protein [Citreimonas salinaria]|uniref:Putative flippase GtrA (Transmembrane translocase of bactoprenol-linked glucose) n=1 Tax=Citreimonas salinaria TaxID=321339 RepID=A0A1H3EZ61_9RHOB|nr:GtrA family protein [Citreimonas salinaria]SDX83847.1 Putative flippase GtrA (transmembrane translocase of bactoprenol-linked glucose) [Citreimonas salinaria]
MTVAGRFLAVAVVGVVLDIAVAYLLADQLGLALWLAAAIGFVTAASVNYVIHETWTFGSGGSLSLQRGGQYLTTCTVALGVRLAAVAGLSALDAGLPELVILICGAAASFAVNYNVSRYLIFSADSTKKGSR